MENLTRSLLAWSRTREGRKLLRFTMTSAITTAVSFTAVAVLYGFRIIPDVMGATLAGNLIGTVPAYHLNRRWTWGQRGRSALRREVAPFVTMSVLGIAFSQLGAFWAKHEVADHAWTHLVDTGLVVGVNLASFAIFWVLKLIVFNRIFHVTGAPDTDEVAAVQERATS